MSIVNNSGVKQFCVHLCDRNANKDFSVHSNTFHIIQIIKCINRITMCLLVETLVSTRTWDISINFKTQMWCNKVERSPRCKKRVGPFITTKWTSVNYSALWFCFLPLSQQGGWNSNEYTQIKKKSENRIICTISILYLFLNS